MITEKTFKRFGTLWYGRRWDAQAERAAWECGAGFPKWRKMWVNVHIANVLCFHDDMQFYKEQISISVKVGKFRPTFTF